mgnify:CR=1 FL=1
MSNTEQKLPIWFAGEVYVVGGKVRNRFTGEEAIINANMLSMYDFIVGSEALIEMTSGFLDPSNAQMKNEMSKGIEWFKSQDSVAFKTLFE